MAHIKLKTNDMHCQSCEILIKEVLEERKGIAMAQASHKSGIISVEYDPEKIGESEIINIIKSEGYEIK